jgi:exodeoxyribonuclease-3
MRIAMALTIATWNVNGIRARAEQVAAWLARDRPEVVCLQEIKARPDQIPESLGGLALEDYWAVWHGTGGYSGVALLVRKDLSPAAAPEVTHPAFDREGRIAVAELPGFAAASVYVPNGGRDYPGKLEFLAALRGWIGERRADRRPLLVCGDLNVALEERDVHPKERKPGQVGTRPEERDLLRGLLLPGLVDLGRRFDPDNDNLFTWWAPWRNLRQRNIGWRIDYLLASPELDERATGARVLAEVGTSDHAPVVATFDYSK